MLGWRFQRRRVRRRASGCVGDALLVHEAGHRPMLVLLRSRRRPVRCGRQSCESLCWWWPALFGVVALWRGRDSARVVAGLGRRRGKGRRRLASAARARRLLRRRRHGRRGRRHRYGHKGRWHRPLNGAAIGCGRRGRGLWGRARERALGMASRVDVVAGVGDEALGRDGRREGRRGLSMRRLLIGLGSA